MRLRWREAGAPEQQQDQNCKRSMEPCLFAVNFLGCWKFLLLTLTALTWVIRNEEWDLKNISWQQKQMCQDQAVTSCMQVKCVFSSRLAWPPFRPARQSRPPLRKVNHDSLPNHVMPWSDDGQPWNSASSDHGQGPWLGNEICFLSTLFKICLFVTNATEVREEQYFFLNYRNKYSF